MVELDLNKQELLNLLEIMEDKPEYTMIRIRTGPYTGLGGCQVWARTHEDKAWADISDYSSW